MALYHRGPVLLSILLGILGFLQASDPPLIPLDQLTVEQAYLEYYLIEKQLKGNNPQNITAKQKAIIDPLNNVYAWHHSKPNDLLPSTLRQHMSNFRQAFINFSQPIKLGTVKYKVTRGFALYLLYDYMVKAVLRYTISGNDEKATSQACDALQILRWVSWGYLSKYEKDNKSLVAEGLDQLEATIRMTRDAVEAMPKFDEKGQLIPGSSWQLTTPSGGYNIKPIWQFFPTERFPNPPNKLCQFLGHRFFPGTSMLLTLGLIGYYLIKINQASSSSSSVFYPKLQFPSKFAISVASKGSSSYGLWYILLLGGLIVALIALGAYWWWYCFKTRGTSKDEAKTASKISKRTTKTKSQQLSTNKKQLLPQHRPLQPATLTWSGHFALCPDCSRQHHKNSSCADSPLLLPPSSPTPSPMALHHTEAVLLALSTLLGILDFLQAWNTSLIPLDKLTIDQAYLECYLMNKQLSIPGTPKATAEQKDILERAKDLCLYAFYKPNDRLHSKLRQRMIEFRQAFANWTHHPVGPLTLLFNKYYALSFLYDLMIGLVESALKKGRGGSDAQQLALSRAKWAMKGLKAIAFQVQLMWDTVKQPDDLLVVEAAILMTRKAVIALPKIDMYGKLVFTGDGVFRLAIEPAGVSSSVPSVVSSDENSAGPAAGNLPGLCSTRTLCKLLYELKQPYIWGPALVLALGASGYYYLHKGHPTPSSSSDFYSGLEFPSKFATSVASEGFSHLWYILLIGGLIVALIALAYWWWCCFKTRGTPEDEAKTASKVVSKRASKAKSRQLSTIKVSPSST